MPFEWGILRIPRPGAAARGLVPGGKLRLLLREGGGVGCWPGLEPVLEEGARVLRLCESSNPKDLRNILEGILLGMLGCIVWYTAFGFCLVRVHADRIASKMELFLLNGMSAVVLPTEPYLRGFSHQLGSALLLGVSLGILLALPTAAVSVLQWIRGSPVKKSGLLLLTLLLVPVCLYFMFSKDLLFFSIAWSLLTPLFFWVPWNHLARRSAWRKRSRLRLILFSALFLLPFYPFRQLSFERIRDAMIDLPIARDLADFYYNHTLVAAHVIQPVRYQTQKLIVLSEDVEFPQSLTPGSLWMKNPNPCSIKGASLAVSRKRLDCPSFLLSRMGPIQNGSDILKDAEAQFDNNRSVRRGVRWFLHGGLPLAVLIWIVWIAALMEDLYQRRRGLALLLAAGSIGLAAYGLYGQYLARALRAHPERTHEYGSSTCVNKRYLGLTCAPDLLTAEDLAALAKDSSPKVRHAAFVRMGERADPGFLAAFTEGLNDPVQIVRTKACWGLGEVGGPDALRLLEQVLAADPSWYVREYAYKAISRIQPVYQRVGNS